MSYLEVFSLDFFLVGFTWRTRFLHVEKVSVNELKISKHVWVKHLLYPFVVSMASPDISYHDPHTMVTRMRIYLNYSSRSAGSVLSMTMPFTHKK